VLCILSSTFSASFTHTSVHFTINLHLSSSSSSSSSSPFFVNFQTSTSQKVPFKAVDDLALVWCAWGEMELRQAEKASAEAEEQGLGEDEAEEAAELAAAGYAAALEVIKRKGLKRMRIRIRLLIFLIPTHKVMQRACAEPSASQVSLLRLLPLLLVFWTLN
jgi:hypothetical protein